MKSVGIIMIIVAVIVLLLCLITVLFINTMDDGGCWGKFLKLLFLPYTLAARQLAIVAGIVLAVGLGLTIYGALA